MMCEAVIVIGWWPVTQPDCGSVLRHLCGGIVLLAIVCYCE
jgi:hypothetical protein